MNYESNQIRQNAYSMNCLLRKLSYFASLFDVSVCLTMMHYLLLVLGTEINAQLFDKAFPLITPGSDRS